VARPPARNELETLEEARAQLEAALAADESWRALRQPASGNARGAAAAARRARNVRLEKALADNELYKAWKHLNQAINMLRTRRPENAEAPVEPPSVAEPQPEESALQRGAPEPTLLQEPAANRIAPGTASSLPGNGESLMRRLAEIDPAAEVAVAAEGATQEQAGPALERTAPDGLAKEEEFEVPYNGVDPPEATVTFVVPEAPRPKQI